MSVLKYEYCCECGNKTGCAGKSDDSLYLEDGRGPFCEPCYDHERRLELEELKEKLEAEILMLKNQLEWMLDAGTGRCDDWNIANMKKSEYIKESGEV